MLRGFTQDEKETVCDSEFYNAEVIKFLQSKKGVTFTIVGDKDAAVKEAIKLIKEGQWRPCYNIHGEKTELNQMNTFITQ